MTVLGSKIVAARAIGSAARRSGRGGGTSLPGKAILRMEPHAIARLSARLPLGSVVISATNGKTTTAAMVAAILGRVPVTIVHNRAGANMAGGIASTLLDAARRGGRISGQLGLFEVDEFWLDEVVAELSPRAIVLANLFRDQLDRYGELDTIADRWTTVAATLDPGRRLVLGADDPTVADLGRDRPDTVYFGVQDDSVAHAAMQHASDSTHCRQCGSPYQYDAVYLGHLGHYHCETCGRRRPEPTVLAREVHFDGTTGVRFTLETPAGSAVVTLPLPGLYNVYNALAAAALCHVLDVPLADIVSGLEQTRPAFGRGETVAVDSTELRLLLVKNPAGANEVIRTIALEPGAIDLLAILNDQIADGRDVSWVWDADFELLSDRIGSLTCAGSRAAELALRFKYAGIPVDRIGVVPQIDEALDTAIAGATGERLFVVPTYTALLALQGELARRGLIDRYWSQTG